MHAVQLVDVVSKAKPAAQKLQEVPVNFISVWYLPGSQSLQTRLVDAVGNVVVYVPAAHLDHGEQVTEGWSFSAW